MPPPEARDEVDPESPTRAVAPHTNASNRQSSQRPARSVRWAFDMSDHEKPWACSIS